MMTTDQKDLVKRHLHHYPGEYQINLKLLIDIVYLMGQNNAVKAATKQARQHIRDTDDSIN